MAGSKVAIVRTTPAGGMGKLVCPCLLLSQEHGQAIACPCHPSFPGV